MKFNKVIEDFNISPKSQNAIQTGPDIGMTTGQINSTFPSNISTIGGKLLPEEIQISITKSSANSLAKILASVLKED